MHTVERLMSYSEEFSPQMVEAVADSVERQNQFDTYHEFLGSVGIADCSKRAIIDVKPKEFDEAEALVMHLPMANPLDANQLYSVATVASLYPNRRIIAAGNPSGVSYGYNLLSKKQREEVAKGNFKPAVEKLVKFMMKQDIERIDQVGESYGADLVVATGQYDEFELGSMVMIEPA